MTRWLVALTAAGAVLLGCGGSVRSNQDPPPCTAMDTRDGLHSLSVDPYSLAQNFHVSLEAIHSSMSMMPKRTYVVGGRRVELYYPRWPVGPAAIPPDRLSTEDLDVLTLFCRDH